jgi:hypothetical protein
MKAGVLGIVDGTFSAVDSVTETVTADGQELERSLQIDRVFSTPAGEMAFEGRAAAETLVDRETARIDGGDIERIERTRTVTAYTEFVGVPGEFMAVDSGDGTFAFDLVAAATDTTIERASLDLDAFFDSHASATPWKAGFSGTEANAVNGVFHGEDLRTTHDLDDILRESSLNQVGLSYAYDGADVKMTAARSGYVEVYRPTAFDSGRYLDYLHEEITPHVQ